MSRLSRYSPEVRERAVRLVREHGAEHPSEWAAIESMAGKLGCTAETLRTWVRQAERDNGLRGGLTTAARQRAKELEREVRELKRIESMAGKLGCTAETLRTWVRQAERDNGLRGGLTTAARQRAKELEREVRELKRINEILRTASAYVAQAELDRRPR